VEPFIQKTDFTVRMKAQYKFVMCCC